MSAHCLACGAIWTADETCRGRFEACLALEYEHPRAFGAVHHLTVLCYMLQHNEYSRESWLEARQMLFDFIYNDVLPADMRQRLSGKVNSGRRTTSITRGPKLAEFSTIVWSHTIAQVRLDTPAIYCADVEQWAKAVLADTASSSQ